MARRFFGGLPPEVVRIAKRLKTFRSRSRGRRLRRLPEGLWARAVDLARRHGVNPIAQALHLDYYGLKRRLLASARSREAPPPVPAIRQAGSFLELVGPSVAPGCAIEMEDGTGRKMTVRLPGAGVGTDLVALTQAFWRRPVGRAGLPAARQAGRAG